MRSLTVVAAFVLLSSPLAFAQTPAPHPPAAPTPDAHVVKAPKAATASLAASGANTTGHSAAAIDCSRQADAKGLHGKARANFRSSCKTAAKKN